uniref:Putative secreted protein n=1 Tax=Anopheles darlingi TaxID=43151 RepID=A0A2M4D2S9_ANODA
MVWIPLHIRRTEFILFLFFLPWIIISFSFLECSDGYGTTDGGDGYFDSSNLNACLPFSEYAGSTPLFSIHPP